MLKISTFHRIYKKYAVRNIQQLQNVGYTMLGIKCDWDFGERIYRYRTFDWNHENAPLHLLQYLLRLLHILQYILHIFAVATDISL